MASTDDVLDSTSPSREQVVVNVSRLLLFKCNVLLSRESVEQNSKQQEDVASSAATVVVVLGVSQF